MNHNKKIAVALDGPAGAGKSTIAKIISNTLKIVYLDTGSMYRAVALKAIREDIDTFDSKKLAELIKNIDIKVLYEGNEQRIFLDGEDVTGIIRTPEVSIGASNVAAVPAVRIKMVELQREISFKDSVIMDGRDIGTYVLPDAELKIFLTASVEERANRRYKELISKGIQNISYEDVKKDIEYRDHNDSSRAFAPLAKASDAVEIDTTAVSAEEAANRIMEYIKAL